MPMRNCYAATDGRPLLEVEAAVAVSSEVEAGCHQRYDVLPVVAVACSAWIGHQRGVSMVPSAPVLGGELEEKGLGLNSRS
ncbi:hypothetical protein MLD38_027595 [Melastoma candidum]|uniref:Uncharacterized protein n=1 Tax=Melastoma candidum TaxID=119954 RepID=A0ACB9P298_9MYRT|nr:hypothetical protein MLD38_027595 [Melastoma candidum]